MDANVPYASAKAVERAISDAAKKAHLNGANQSTTDLVRTIVHDRFMSRIFSDGDESSWVLKGGNGILARIPHARATRDIDIVTAAESLAEAVENLISLSNRDLGDFFTFRIVGEEVILEGDQQPDSEGTRLSFEVFLGTKQHSNVIVDVVVSKSIPQVFKLEEPASRINIPKLVSHKYRLWPIENQIADKVAATLATYASGESSRSRDLFDLLAIAQTQALDAKKLTEALSTELIGRGLVMNQTFDYPANWWEAIKTNFAGSPFLDAFQNDHHVRELLNRLVFPPAEGAGEYFWNPGTQDWSAVRLNLPKGQFLGERSVNER